MKKIIKQILSVLIFLFIWSCEYESLPTSDIKTGPKPTAAFSVSTSLEDPQTIIFNNTSENVQSVFWQFGDNTTSTEFSPIHSYAIGGIYKVILKTKSEAGYEASDTLDVIAAGTATASFNISQNGLKIKLENTSSSVNSLLWDFGDGNTSTEISPEYEYSSSGTYIIKLTIHGLAGDLATCEKEVSVNKDYINGGDMEDANFWTIEPGANWYPLCNYQFGSSTGSPEGGTGGCLRLWWDETAIGDKANAGCNIYQEINLEEGKQYHFSALIKQNPGKNSIFQFFIESTPDITGKNAFAEINTYLDGCGTSVLNGNIMDVACRGTGMDNNGIFTATSSKMYVILHLHNYQGSFGGDILIDNISVTEIK